MATLASAAGSSFVQQQRQISVETTTAASAPSVGISTTPTTIIDCTPSLTSSASSASSSSSSSCSSTSSSCESGVVLSGSSICSSMTNSPTSTTSSFIANAAAVKTLTAATASASTTLMTASILPASLLAVSVTSTPPADTNMSLSSTSLSLPLLSSSYTPISSSYTPISSSATTTSLESVAPSTEQHAPTVSSNTSAHQLLLNGLSVSDADLNGTVNSSSLVEDPRALQLALELSMVGLNDSVHLQVQQQQLQLQQLQQQHLQHMQQQQQQLSQQHQQQQSQHQQQQSSFDMSALSAAVAAAAAAANSQVPNHSSTATQLNQFSSALLPGIEDRSKKSQNMTECVPVPSSEHVAEIVGRQGCKIKALRAKTNTYIKTPVRGEEPVFVVTGRKEDVAKAKREILSAAEHFSVIRASRKPSLAGSLTGSLNGTGSSAKTPPGPPSIPGQVTIQVRVPYRVVGLVVGPKGATIKHIQQETQTYIVTPSREKEPIFEVTGLPDNVQAARKQIEAHIALRTGNLAAPAIDASTAAVSNGNGTVHTINSLSQILSEDVSPEFLASIYKNSLCSTFDYADGCINSLNTVPTPPVSTNSMGINLNLTACSASQTLINDITSSMSIANNFQLPSGANISNDFLSSIISRSTVDDLNGHQVFGGGLNLNINSGGNITNGSILSSTATGINLNGNINHNSVVSGIGMSRSCSSASSTTSSKSANNGGGSNSSRPELSNIWKNLSDSLDVDEGIGESPSIWTLPSSLATLSSHYSPAISISPTDSLLGEANSLGQLLATQTQQQQQQRTTVSLNSSSNGIMPQQPHILHHNQHNLGVRRECLICGDKEITAALVPCGHNLFCMECANRICASPEGICPVCSQSVFHAMRILP